jgi:hypothetical protein
MIYIYNMALKIFILICILAAIYYYKQVCTLEPMSGMGGSGRCPNMLIQKGSAFFLYNTKLAEVPGVNPVREYDALSCICKKCMTHREI